MTPLQMANQECANRMPGGGCLGVAINKQLAITSCNPAPKCVLSDSERCFYFEECVLPMADFYASNRNVKGWKQAAMTYRRQHGAVT